MKKPINGKATYNNGTIKYQFLISLSEFLSYTVFLLIKFLGCNIQRMGVKSTESDIDYFIVFVLV